METGSRREIVRREGLRPTNLFRFAVVQSTYCVESSLAQNSRSWSSLLNSGSFFFIPLIVVRFVAVHIPDRNHPDEFCPYGKRNKQATAHTCLAEGVISLLFCLSRMPGITVNDQRIMKEDVLGFFWRHLVTLPILVRIAFVPIEPDAII